MCGIVGYSGNRDAYPILLNALVRLEYRGYDSCGVAIDSKTAISVVKSVGSVQQMVASPEPIMGFRGIGHTRWATVGEPSLENAHPHLDCTKRYAIVHNGEIHNYSEIKERLQDEGHTFTSETDSEVIAHLIESYSDSRTIEKVAKALKEINGSYALVVMDRLQKALIVARRESPLVLGLNPSENFVASDVSALVEHTRDVVFLEDGDIGTLDPSGFKIWHEEVPAKRSVHNISWNPREMDKSGYEHYFLKEIHEQPRVIRDILAGKVATTDTLVKSDVTFSGALPPDRIVLSGCGSAFHACLVGERFLSEFLPSRVSAQLSSEGRWLNAAVPNGSWGIFLSQSGETADTLSAARDADRAGFYTIGITSGQETSLSRIVQTIQPMETGLEISVGSTKTLIAQMLSLYLLGLQIFPVSKSRLHELLTEIRLLPTKVQRALSLEAEIERIASSISSYRDMFFIAKGISYPIALEGALKLKEIAYVHAEAYPAGELKHGPLALVTDQTPVIAIMPKGDDYERVATAIREVKARGAPVIAITTHHSEELSQLADEVIQVPEIDEALSPMLTIIPIQLLAYYIAKINGRPIDRPRNLAKSVTVH